MKNRVFFSGLAGPIEFDNYGPGRKIVGHRPRGRSNSNHVLLQKRRKRMSFSGKKGCWKDRKMLDTVYLLPLIWGCMYLSPVDEIDEIDEIDTRTLITVMRKQSFRGGPKTRARLSWTEAELNKSGNKKMNHSCIIAQCINQDSRWGLSRREWARAWGCMQGFWQS